MKACPKCGKPMRHDIDETVFFCENPYCEQVMVMASELPRVELAQVYYG